MNPAIKLASQYVGNLRQIDDHLFAGGQPQLCQGIGELVDKYHIKTIIDLQGHDVDTERNCTPSGVTFISIPLPGIEIFDEPPQNLIDLVMTQVNAPDNWPVFVHCLHGSDRTGAIVGIYRVEQGATAKEAIKEMRAFGNQFIEFGFRKEVEEFYEAKEKEQK